MKIITDRQDDPLRLTWALIYSYCTTRIETESSRVIMEARIGIIICNTEVMVLFESIGLIV